MSVVTNLVSNVVDAVTDRNTSGRQGLDDFLSKFNNPQKYVETIDPLGTFDVVFKFFPTIDVAKNSGNGDAAPKLLNALGAAADKALTNALDSVTGGIYSSIKGAGQPGVMQQRGEFTPGRYSFMEYLLRSNLVADSVSQPVQLSLGMYVQSIAVPNLQTNGGSQQTSLGDFPTAGGYVGGNGALNMSVLNTKASLHERIFYPWLRETTLPYWCYDQQPFTTATITIDYTKHNDVKYVFCGCRPTEIKTLQATQQADSGNIVRDVTFAYDFMFVTSELKTYDSAKDKILDALGTIGSGVARALNAG